MKNMFLVKKSISIFALTIFAILCIIFLVALISAFIPTFHLQSNMLENNAHSKTEGLWNTTIFTLKQALLSTLLALIIGISAAFFTARRKFFGKKFLLSMSAIPMCMPTLLVALGFVMFLGIQGSANRFLMKVCNLPEPPLTFLYSFWGIIIAHGFYNFPIIMKTCHNAWASIPAKEYDAALLLGAKPSRIFRTVTLFHLIPSIVSSAILVFIFCFFSFVIVLLFGGVGTSVLEVEIYQTARTTLNFAKASKLAIIETGIAAISILIYSYIENKNNKTFGIAFDNERIPQKKLNKTETIIFILFLILIFFFFIAPFFSILFAAFTKKGFTLANFQKLFLRKSFWNAFFNTIITGLSTATLSVISAVFLACITSKKKSTLLKTLSLLPMAVSSVVLGMGMTFLVHKGNPFILILAQASIFWPFAYKQISASMEQIPQNILDASSCLSINKLDIDFMIRIPMCFKSILSAFSFCFAMSAGDATLPLMLAIPKFETLALHTYKLAGSYRFQEACACGVILAIITVPLFIFTNTEKRGKTK